MRGLMSGDAHPASSYWKIVRGFRSSYKISDGAYCSLVSPVGVFGNSKDLEGF
mgnify:CR=1 FL=1